MKGRPIQKFEKSICKSIEEIEHILFNIREGNFNNNNAAFIISGTGDGIITKGEEKFIVVYEDGHRSFMIIDQYSHTIALSGEWWYCGVYTLIKETSHQTKIIYEVYNAANNLRWLVPFVTHNKKGMKEGFYAFVTKLEYEINKNKSA